MVKNVRKCVDNDRGKRVLYRIGDLDRRYSELVVPAKASNGAAPHGVLWNM